MHGFYLIIFGPLVRVKDLIYVPPSPLIHYTHIGAIQKFKFDIAKSRRFSITLQ